MALGIMKTANIIISERAAVACIEEFRVSLSFPPVRLSPSACWGLSSLESLETGPRTIFTSFWPSRHDAGLITAEKQKMNTCQLRALPFNIVHIVSWNVTKCASICRHATTGKDLLGHKYTHSLENGTDA